MELPKTELVDTMRRVSFSWLQRFVHWDQVAEAQRSGGPTSSRPKRPYRYQQYFDTTLGKPVWAKVVGASSVTWVDAAGATV